MALFGKPEKMPPPKEEKKDSSIFGENSFIKSEGLRKWARSDSAFKTTKLSQGERGQRIKQIFRGKDFIDREKTEKQLKKLQMEKYQAKTDSAKKDLEKDIKIVKGILGKKI